MKRKLVIIGLVSMLLIVGKVHGQDSLENVRRRARLFEPLILDAAARHSVDPHLLWTIAYLESRFDPHAISYKDGRPCGFGLMQFIPSTAAKYGLRDPHQPRQAIDAAARYVRELMQRFEGRRDLILAAYNAGEGTVEAFRDGRTLTLTNGKIINPKALRTDGIPPYRETRNYVARGALIYREIAGKRLFTAPTELSRMNQSNNASDLDSKPRASESSTYAGQVQLREKHLSHGLSLYAN